MVYCSTSDHTLPWADLSNSRPVDDSRHHQLIPRFDTGHGLRLVTGDAAQPGASASVERASDDVPFEAVRLESSIFEGLPDLDAPHSSLPEVSPLPSNPDEEVRELDLSVPDGLDDPSDLARLPRLNNLGQSGLASWGADALLAIPMLCTAADQVCPENVPATPLARTLSEHAHVGTPVRALEFGDKPLPLNSEEEVAMKVKSAHKLCNELSAVHTALQVAIEASTNRNLIRRLYSMYRDARARVHRLKCKYRDCSEAVQVFQSRSSPLAAVETPLAVLGTKTGQAARELRNAKVRVSKMCAEICGKSRGARQRRLVARYQRLERHIGNIVAQDGPNVHKKLINWWYGLNCQPQLLRQELGIYGEPLRAAMQRSVTAADQATHQLHFFSLNKW